ncbi:MAG: hypothetical protein IJU65_00275 [Desulfovibrio sp.]|nr:hypothetical protein [Desulfovibrio sp.]
MSFKSILQGLFKAPTSADDAFQDDNDDFEWNQHARIMLAVLIVILSAFVLYWILV